MAQARLPRTPPVLAEVTHLRPPQPIHFPEEAEVPEGKRHLVLRTFLFRLLRFALGPAHSVGSDQFVYWNAREPRRCLSPDVFVKTDVADSSFGSWKTWEHGGVPELAVEIISPNEGDGVSWDDKLTRYHELGVRELLRFDPEGPQGKRLRAWDRLREDLVERQIAGDRTPCLTLGLSWSVCAVESEPVGLRLVDDEGRLLETLEEAEARARSDEARARVEAERGRAEEARARVDAEKAQAEEARARAAAEARVRELEAELARRSSGSN